ncbi:MAG: DNA polymerase/3'-5' exonuclease PolX, partial [Verrucomicrobiota bacterium]|nr:DNA polymerase/3'-5' exonuclease PolX [Verrucomicrobiota bacterium]
MTKNEIAAVLNEAAMLLELKGENPFKVRAYQTGARAVEALEEARLAALIKAEGLRSVKGIGETLAQKIAELYTTGQLKFYDELKASIVPGLVEMLQIPGLGAKRIRVLSEKLKITSIAELTDACAKGLIAELAGFGEKSQQKILAGIKNREAYSKRHSWWEALAAAEPILAGLRALPQVVRAEAAGSLRRGLETVGDLDFIVAAREVGPVTDWFTRQPQVLEVTALGETKASVRFVNGLQADLRIVPQDQFVFALHHFTGSKDHNVQMRQRALARGFSLSEWGLVLAEGEGTAKEKAGNRQGAAQIKTEKDLFAALGLHYIPPELREGLGEIEVAERGELPRLIELGDLRGAFHNHTTASDGRNTLNEMAAAAAVLGWEYLGIADHSKSSFQANGLSEERLLQEVAEISALNKSRRIKIHLFAGVECDILPDGRLDYGEDVLGQLDYVVASVHSAFAQDEAAMTKRIIRALESSAVTMLGHLTGRLLLRREGYPVDAAKVIDAAIANNVIIELNANPHRLDMDWRHWRRAAEKGLFCAINPDAHDTAGLKHVRAGVNAARKGWLTADRVLNTWPLKEVKAFLQQKCGKRP